MPKFRGVCILLILFCLLANASVASNRGAEQNRPDVRSEIALLIQDARDAFGKLRIVDLDTGIARMDTAIALAAEHFGPNDTTIATALAWQSLLYGWKMDVPKCEELISRSLNLLESQLGSDHPALAVALWIKSILYMYLGRHGEKRSLLLRAHELIESKPDFDPELRAYILMDIGLDHIHRQENSEAVAARKKALEIFKQLHGPDHWTAGMACQGTGFAFHHLGELDSAQVYYERAREIFLQSLGPEMTRTAHNMDYLSRVYWDQGRDDLREEMLYRGLPILEKAVGNKHLLVVEFLLKIAEFEIAQGRYYKAVLYAERAAQLGSELGIASWPSGDLWTAPLAQALRGSGDINRSLAVYQESIMSKQDFIKGIFEFVSEDTKMKYLRRNPLINHAIYALATEMQSPEAIEVALQMLLAGKAVIIDALAGERQVAYCFGNDEVSSLLSDHADVCREIAEFITSGGHGYPASEIRARLDSLDASKSRLESQISGHCAEFAEAFAIRHFSVGDVAAAIPAGSALLEFCTYRPNKLEGTMLKWQPERYLVFSLQSDGRIDLVDLGESSIIDSLVSVLHEMLSNAPQDIALHGESAAETELREITDRLHNRIIEPLEQTLGQCSHIFVSPDGQLQLLPLEILTSGGTYLAENYEISYLSSGRDLLEHNKPVNETENNAIIFAGPDYDLLPAASPPVAFAVLNVDDSEILTRGPSDRTECLAVPFDPLPATIMEGEIIAKLLLENSDMAVERHSLSEASEQLVKGIQNPPRLLHLATHGYFCSRADFTDAGLLTENPLLYSGLAMAGVNRTVTGEWDSESGGEDGLLTALEASGLNLVGTELVVLSACQSGVGEVMNAEGIYGLRRAFQHAGARSIVMSMYDAPDQSTASLMERFYTNWLSGSTKAASLRKASLSLLEERRRQNGTAHPLYWGGFILTGNPD